MLIPLKGLLQQRSITPHGVVQIGCHWSEEDEIFKELGIVKRVYIEPCQAAFEVLMHKFENDIDVILYNVACGDIEGEMAMHVSHQNQGQSNSLLAPELHLTQHPEIKFDDAEIVKVVKLDNLDFKKRDFNILVADVQGYEYEVLKGAFKTLDFIDLVYVEVNRGQTYRMNKEIEQIDELLAFHKFKRVATQWASPHLSWGDAAYVKDK